ncbi:MAG: NUDIX domain-containing protein [Sporichthyaceae bacterium]
MATGVRSAGILVFRRTGAAGVGGTAGAEASAATGAAAVEVLLGHLGGPFWARKQEHAWSAPKGEHEPDEAPLVAAHREFVEETGQPVPAGDLLELGSVRQSGGKVVTLWAVEGDLDAAACASNTFTIEWPPRSGRTAEFPELERFAWVDVATARELVVKGQVAFLDRLLDRLAGT